MFLTAPSLPMVVFLDKSPLPYKSSGNLESVCEGCCLFVPNHNREESEARGAWGDLNVPDSSVLKSASVRKNTRISTGP